MSLRRLGGAELQQVAPRPDQSGRVTDGTLIPGLPQTPEFAAHSLLLSNPHAPDAEIKSMVKTRIDRQARLSHPKPLRCWFILDEAALRRAVGGPAVMHLQSLMRSYRACGRRSCR
ncbi:Scr1 family TA system antitoxin-like transcriptional regulator [Streptomyces sp. NPDC057600]